MKFANSLRLGALAVALNSVPAVHAAVRGGVHSAERQQDHEHDARTDAASSAGLRRTQVRGNNNKEMAVSTQPQGPQGKPFRKTTCTTTIADVQGLPEGRDHLKLGCEDFNTGAVRDLDVDTKWKHKAIATGALEPGDEIEFGEATLGADGKIHPKNKIPRGITKKLNPKVKKPNGNNANKGRRGLAQVTGTKSVLAVMITTGKDGKSYTDSGQTRNRLENDLFLDDSSLKTQYSKCSHGKLDFVMANDRDGGTGTNIRNGIVEITVPNFANETDSVVFPAASEVLAAEFGVAASALANHVMYCLPPDTLDGIAYAGVDRWYSVYSDTWCNYVSAQLHEIGHNLNLGHSDENGEYRDTSGMMGFSYSLDDQSMCFNNAKNWQLGWFSDRQLEVTAGECHDDLELAGQVNYDPDDPDSRTVVVKINSASNTDYYVGFNHRVKHNKDTGEGRNMVTIQRSTTEGRSGTPGGGYAHSELVAKLAIGAKWTENVGGSTVTVTVKSINVDPDTGFASVKISHGADACGCTSDAECNDFNACNGVEICNSVTEKCEAGQPVGGERIATIKVTTDDYCEESSWQLADPEGSTLLVRGLTETLNDGTTYTDTVQVCPSDRGEFCFSMADSYGDGICCSYGSGSYSVELDGEEVVSGGEFSSKTETKCFPVDPLIQPTTPTVSPVAAPTTPTTNPVAATTTPTANPVAAPTTSTTTTTTTSAAPTSDPTSPPTDSPSKAPTTSTTTTTTTSAAPTSDPTSSPSESPSKAPTTSTTTTTTTSAAPTSDPTSPPTDSPSKAPTTSTTTTATTTSADPTGSPTESPSKAPTTSSTTTTTTTSTTSTTTTEAPTTTTTTEDPTVCADPRSFSLILTTDDYPAETTWELKNVDTSAVVLSGDGNGNRAGTTVTHSAEVCAPAAYEFTIRDVWQDGICCDYGTGSYSIYLDDVEISTEDSGGANFGGLATTAFDVRDGPILEGCGNDICEEDESCGLCPSDCGECPPTNLALLQPATQSSTLPASKVDANYGGGDGAAFRANNGNKNGDYRDFSVSHTDTSGACNWWRVDLGADDVDVGLVKVYNRRDCCSNRLFDFTVEVLAADGTTVVSDVYREGEANVLTRAGFPVGTAGRYVKIRNGCGEFLSLAEVEVFANSDGTAPAAAAKPATSSDKIASGGQVYVGSKLPPKPSKKDSTIAATANYLIEPENVTPLKPKNAACTLSSECLSGSCHGNKKCK